jgi:hypothetical protein
MVKKEEVKDVARRIKMLLRQNYKLKDEVLDLIDLESEVDTTLTFQENWNHIVKRYVKPTPKEAKII